MRRLFVLALLGVVMVGLGGCSWHKETKQGTRVYEGNSPNMRMNDKPETAGGRVNAY